MTMLRWGSLLRSSYCSALGFGRAAVASRPAWSSSATILASTSGCWLTRNSVHAPVWDVVSSPAQQPCISKKSSPGNCLLLQQEQNHVLQDLR